MKKRILIIIIIFIIVLAFVINYCLLFKNTKELVCTSSQGSVTIKYSKNTILDVKTKNISYFVEEHQSIVDKKGMDTYLKEYKDSFESFTDGTCK